MLTYFVLFSIAFVIGSHATRVSTNKWSVSYMDTSHVRFQFAVIYESFLTLRAFVFLLTIASVLSLDVSQHFLDNFSAVRTRCLFLMAGSYVESEPGVTFEFFRTQVTDQHVLVMIVLGMAREGVSS